MPAPRNRSISNPIPSFEAFPNNVQGSIELCRKRIAAGIAVEAHKAYLSALENTCEIPASNGEPEGLDPRVYERIVALKRILDSIPGSGYTESENEMDAKNATAVLTAYRAGILTIKDGQSSCWSDGRMFAPLEKRTMEDVLNCATSAPTAGNFWLEDPTVRFFC